MNPAVPSADLAGYLTQAEKVILPGGKPVQRSNSLRSDGNLHVGVDLGTAYLVLVALDENYQPLAGEYRWAQVVRDGLVVDFIGAIDLLREMKDNLENRLGVELTHAASGYPPGVPSAEVRATAHVVEAAGMSCNGLLDEPTAANNVLGIRDGAIVDVGGGTTGIAVLRNGKVVYSADEATGGTHFSLVIAGANNISFEEAEELKKNPSEQARLYPLIRPVMQKVASITSRHLKGRSVDQITIVGGTACFPGLAQVVEEYTGIPTQVPEEPLFITPIGIAMHDQNSSKGV